MGQRLVVTIKYQEKDLAKIYYHWSAYTTSALYETKSLINCIYNHEDETAKELQLRLIRYCEENGGGIDGNASEFEYIENMFPGEAFVHENYSRSNGLIALSEKCMNEMQCWSEGDVEIDLDNEVVTFGVFGWYEDLEQYNKERQEWEEEDFVALSYEDIVDIGYDLGQFDIAHIDEIAEIVGNLRDHICRYGNEIYEMTE